jgi:pyruvate kinase
MKMYPAAAALTVLLSLTNTQAFTPSLSKSTQTQRNTALFAIVNSSTTSSTTSTQSEIFNPDFGSGKTTVASTTTVASVPRLAQRWRKSTKQLATLGPASQNKEMIEKLFLAGADVFRLNFSHGSQEQKKELLIMIREIEEKYSHPIAILGDLQGPKLRVSVVKEK